MPMTSQLPGKTTSPIFFDVAVFLLPSLVIGLSFMSISLLVLETWLFSFYKGLTRNSEVGNNPVWAFPNIWRLGWVKDTKFCTNVTESCKMLELHLLPFLSYYFFLSFYDTFEELKEPCKYVIRLLQATKYLVKYSYFNCLFTDNFLFK